MRLFLILILLVALVCVGRTSNNPTIKVASDGIARVVDNGLKAAVLAVQNWAEQSNAPTADKEAVTVSMTPEERRGWITGKYQKMNRKNAERD